MKTLIITLEYPPQVGGIASFVHNLALHLPPEEVVVCASVQAGAKEFDANYKWKTYRVKPYFSVLWPHWLRLLWHVWKIVKKENIQQIYVNHALPVGYVAKFINKFRKIPFAVFFHGTDLEIGAKLKKKKLESVCRSADVIMVNSQFLFKKLFGIFPNLDQNKVKVFYPCPADFFFDQVADDIKRKMRSELALDGKKVILTVARLDDGKGYPHLAHLMPKILEKVPNAVWLVIGDGPKRKTFLEQIQKAGMENIVRFLGKVPYADLPKYYQLADVFVLLTHKDKDESKEEAWGTVFVEAAASGLPVVAGRAGGVEEAVINLQTGVLVDIYQEAGVISAITEFLKNPQYAHQIGEAGRVRAKENFFWDKQIQK